MDNFRDFAYSNMKKGMLFRGKGLSRITDTDKQMLINNNIKVIVDLRTLEERLEEKDIDIPGINNINISMSSDDINDENSGERMEYIMLQDLKVPDITIYYRQMVRRYKKDAWTKIFNILLTTDGAIYFHCTAGKDRTGVTAAIIQSALGLDKETIYNDYFLTNKSPISPGFQQYLNSIGPELGKMFLNHFSARREYLDATFDEINKVYGSLDNFFVECCSLDENKLKQLKAKYLTNE